MTEEVIVDANVPAVANGLAPQAGDGCLQRTITELRRIQSACVRGDCRVLLDDQWLMLREYQGVTASNGGSRAGDAFVKWLLNMQFNVGYVRRVAITPNADREFEEFPDDPVLASFDRDDRKFVAVARASGASPNIVNAVDTDWWEYREVLMGHGVSVRFLCPDLMPGN